jgi:mRNA interferase MazF
MKRGEVWWVAFGPSRDGEIRKERPALVISNEASNRHLNRVQVVPLTSNVERVYPSEALVTLAGRPVKAMADQLTTVAKARLIDLAGRLSPSELQRVERAVMVQFGLGNLAPART